MTVSTALLSLTFRPIFTFATIFSHSTFLSFSMHFMKSANIVNEIIYYLLEVILKNNVLAFEFQYSASARRYSTNHVRVHPLFA